MKENITRIKQINITEKDKKNFKISLNINEDSDSLDIALIDIKNASNDPEDRFFYILNGTPYKLDIQDEPVPFSTKNGMLYQFSIDFDKLASKKNLIAIFKTPNTEGNDISLGEIEFFKEVEDTVTNIRLERPGIENTPDQELWEAISNHVLDFKEYERFIDTIICGPDSNPNIKYKNQNFDDNSGYRPISKIRSPFIKSEEYNLIKFATDFYMMAKFGLDTRALASYTKNTGGRLPYYDVIIEKIREDATIKELLNTPVNGTSTTSGPQSDCMDSVSNKLYNPIMIELIWNYWMEQGMLVQTMNVINLHFQNIKVSKYPSALDRLHTDPLRPLSHILWGFIQDEQHRLSLPRRVNEYDHEYGLTLTGRAVPQFNAADTRVKFLEAFHNLLNLAIIYFKESDDTTYIADAFPILTALREVHLILAEGNHNAYGNLTWTARQEMMIQQYILSRGEMREFLGGRVMVPYPETWMDRVDTMRNIMGWGATSILHFYELAIHGEQVLLSIRYGNWSDVKLDRKDAANWAQKFRNPIYRYLHAYRAATGVDLTTDKIQSSGTFALQPAYLLQQRLIEEKPAYRMQQQQLLMGRNRKAS